MPDLPSTPTVCWAWTDPAGVRRATLTFSPSAYRLGLWDETYDVEVDGKYIGAYPANQAVPIAKMACWEIVRKEFKSAYRAARVAKTG